MEEGKNVVDSRIEIEPRIHGTSVQEKHKRRLANKGARKSRKKNRNA